MVRDFSPHWILVSCLAAAAALSGCGGGDSVVSGGSSSVTLTGLAATGAGIANGTVTVQCVSGAAQTGTTDGNGVFTLTLAAGRALPCMLQITNGTPNVTLYSFAQTEGRVNITPATDLIVARALGADPAVQFAAFDTTKGSAISASLAAARTYVNNQLSAITGSPLALDPISGAFAVGDADDKVLDALGLAMTASNKDMAALRNIAKDPANSTALLPAFLGAPANPTATANGANQITVTWASAPGASSYKVYRAATAAAIDTSAAATGTTNANSFVDTGLLASTAYHYKVVAANSVATSLASASVMATTSAASGGGSGLTCDTTKFASGAAVANPTAEQLSTFARTYTGSEGDYGSNPTDPFVASGSATLVFNANGTATYNGANYVPSSYCLETLSGGAGTQLVIHSGVMSHFDLKTSGVWTGYSEGGKVVTNTAYSGGGSQSPSTWTSHSISSGWFSDVIWDGGKFVALGSYVGTSTDGATWTFNALLEGKGIAKSGSTLVLAGISTATGSDIRKSVNGGTTWIKPATANIFTVTGNPSMFVGIGGGAEAGNGQAMVIKSSTDGETWTTRHTETVPNNQSKITSLKPVWSGSTWLISAFKYDPTITTNFYDKYEFFVLTSTDGLAWTKTVVTNVKGNYTLPWWAVWNGTQFVMIDKAKTLKSSNGTTWAVATSDFTPTTYDFVDWSGSEFVAFSGGGSNVKIWTSPDAVTWTSRTTTATQPIYGGVSNGTSYVAVGNAYTFTSP